MKYLKFNIFFLISLILITSCSESTCSKNSSKIIKNTSLTIDSAGTIPIFSNMASSSVIYVHNNSNEILSNISYTGSDSNINTDSLKNTKDNTPTIDPASAKNCATINPRQSCPLAFTTATPNSKDFKGSIIINASYQEQSDYRSYSQIINYAQVHSLTKKGVLINSGVIMHADLHATAYGVVYAYGSGESQIYRVNDLTLDKSGVIITQGNIKGSEVSSYAIQAIEIMVPGIDNNNVGVSVQLRLTSSDLNTPSETYVSTATNSLTVNPLSNGAILIAGNSPVINVTSGNTGTVNIYNAGNTTATAISPSFGTGVSANGGTCGSTLAAYAGCTLGFKITSANNSGSANISISYSSGIYSPVVVPVSWYSAGSALLGISATPSPIVFNASQQQAVTVTISNLGSVSVTNLAIVSPTIVSGTATAAASGSGDTCTGVTLNVNDTCSYVFNMNASSATSGSVNFGISGGYNSSQTYSRITNSSYIVNAYAALLSVTIPSFTIVGDNSSTQVQTVTINNTGSAPATLGTDSLTNTTGYTTTLTGSGCTSPIAAGGSCTVRTITFGPVTNSGGSIINVTGTNSTFAYNIPYSGGSQSLITSTTPLNATITPGVNLTISAFSATNSASGAGTSASPYNFSGATPSGQVVTVTYKNTGLTPITITGVNNTNSGFQWLIDTTNSTCYASNIPNAALAVNSTCTVIFNNVISSNFYALGSIGSTYTMNLTLPQITYVTSGSVQFQQIPTTPAAASSIFVNSLQAVMVNSASQTGTIAGGGTVTITNTFSNTSGYTQIIVNSNTEDYFTGSPTLTNCTQSTASGVITLVCTLTPSLLVGSGVFSLASFVPVSSILHINFSISGITPSGAFVSFNPLYLVITLN